MVKIYWPVPLTGQYCRTHGLSTLSMHLVNPVDVDAYLLSPQGSATHFITNSPAPHETRKELRSTCLWEVVWKGDKVQEHFPF